MNELWMFLQELHPYAFSFKGTPKWDKMKLFQTIETYLAYSPSSYIKGRSFVSAYLTFYHYFSLGYICTQLKHYLFLESLFPLVKHGKTRLLTIPHILLHPVLPLKTHISRGLTRFKRILLLDSTLSYLVLYHLYLL